DHLPMVADYTDTVTPPVGPIIDSMSVNPPSVGVGASVTFTANNVTEAGSGTVIGVQFYRESNLQPGLQIGSDMLVGAGTRSGANWSLMTTTSGLSGGVYTFYAVATDSNTFKSDEVSATLTVNGPAAPVIGSFTVSPTTVTAGTLATLTAHNVTRTGGTIYTVRFYRESNGTAG